MPEEERLRIEAISDRVRLLQSWTEAADSDLPYDEGSST